MSVEPVLNVSSLYSELTDCLLQDQFRLRRRLNNCKKIAEQAVQQQMLQKIAVDIARSVAQRALRLCGAASHKLSDGTAGSSKKRRY
ncbi:hypothetical protein [Arsukibacterium sp.]|uniref:hypothetical protein n=1 Tax=Arsukibacterium sp. TaxID=1977258 RepID=UPI00260EF447|nr:hypothetical protein [Arsukibacterium sp.]